MKEIVGKISHPILKAFLEAEAKEFGLMGKERREWVRFRLRKIEEEIGKKQKRFENFQIKSFGNAGAEIRRFECSPTDKWYGTKRCVEVALCTCGKNKHWGRMTLK